MIFVEKYDIYFKTTHVVLMKLHQNYMCSFALPPMEALEIIEKTTKLHPNYMCSFDEVWKLHLPTLHLHFACTDNTENKTIDNTDVFYMVTVHVYIIAVYIIICYIIVFHLIVWSRRGC